MEPTLYKELSYKVQGFRLVSWLIAAVTLLLCLLVGIGCYILIVGMNENLETIEREKITIIEGEIKEPLDAIVVPGRFSYGRSNNIEEISPVAHLNHANNLQNGASDPSESAPPVLAVHPHNYKTSFSNRYPIVAGEGKAAQSENSQKNDDHNDQVLDALSQLTSRDVELMDDFEERPSQQYMDQTIKMLDNFASQFENDEHHRSKRSPLIAGLLSYIPYVSYASFGKFMYNQVSDIAQYRMQSRSFQSRKLGGDPIAQFLDGIYWNSPVDKPSVVKKASAYPEEVEVNEEEQQENEEKVQSGMQAKPGAGWQPMVNQVPLSFVAEILRSLLNLMKSFLMRDNVMECLWYMFCQDVNHQAKYTDMYGIIARVNSVGLKVLTEKELRHTDTFGDVFRAVTSWSALQCDAMFPKCDGPRALEIVNEVALGN